MKKVKQENKDHHIEVDLVFGNLRFISEIERKYITNQIKLISKTLKELRVDLGFSQEELAEITAVSLPTIKAIEQNTRLPSLPMLLKILFFIDHQRTGKSRECLI